MPTRIEEVSGRQALGSWKGTRIEETSFHCGCSDPDDWTHIIERSRIVCRFERSVCTCVSDQYIGLQRC